jgi:hypothetical protein
MLLPTTIVKKGLSLQQSHCQQWKTFFADEIKRRHGLALKHQKEKDLFNLQQRGPFERASLIRMQMFELWEFRISTQEKRVCLENIFYREKDEAGLS